MIIFLLIMVTNLLAITEVEQDRYIRAVVSKDPRNVQPFIDTFGVNELLDTNNNTALHYAAQNDDARTVQFLIANGAQVDAVNSSGRTPLQEAERFKNYLLENYFNGGNPLHWALYDNKKLSEVEELINKNKDWLNSTDKNGNTPLHVAVKYSDTPVLKLLVTRGSNLQAINKFGRNPLQEAQNLGRKDLLLYLSSNNPLQWAISEPERFASTTVSNEIKKLVQEQPELINRKDMKGNTPLHAVANNPNIELAKFLIAHGADITAKNEAGLTPSKIANNDGNYFYELILKTSNPLQWAIYAIKMGETNLVSQEVKKLINENPSLINQKDIEGNTPLHAVAETNNVGLAKYLVEHGANIMDKNNKGKTAYDLARSNDIRAMMDYLSPKLEPLFQAFSRDLSLINAIA